MKGTFVRSKARTPRRSLGVFALLLTNPPSCQATTTENDQHKYDSDDCEDCDDCDDCDDDDDG